MIYTLILTVFLGFPGNFIPVTTEITFKTEKECLMALETAVFSTEIPVVGAKARCEKQPQT